MPLAGAPPLEPEPGLSMGVRLRLLALSIVQLLVAAAASAQVPTGYVSLFGDYFPNRSDTTELRARVFVEEKAEKAIDSNRVVVTASGFVEGLFSRRVVPDSGRGLEAVNGGIARVLDANVDVLTKRIDVLVGYARIVWGKLDEIPAHRRHQSARRVPFLLRRA